MIPRAKARLWPALALACAAWPAQATPPDRISLRDEIFAISADTLFLLRVVSDNFGLYGTDMRSAALIAVDRATGQEELLPLYRSLGFPDYDHHPDGARAAIRPVPPPGAVDLFATLRDRKAALLFPLTEADATRHPVDRPGDATPVTIHDVEGGSLTLNPAGLQARVIAAGTRFAAAMGDYERMGPLSLSDLMADYPFAPGACGVGHALSLHDRSGPTPVTLVNLHCGNPDEDDFDATVFLLIPRTG